MKDINFFEGVKKSTPQKKAASAVKICSIALIAVTILVGGVYAFLFIQGKNIDNNISEIKQQIDNIKNENSGVDLINDKKKKLEALISYTKQAQTFKESVDVYPLLNAKFYQHVENRMPSDVRLDSMEYKDGTIKITCLAKKTLSPATFAEKLKTHKSITKINYSGNFVVSDETNMLQFTIECDLKGEQ